MGKKARWGKTSGIGERERDRRLNGRFPYKCFFCKSFRFSLSLSLLLPLCSGSNVGYLCEIEIRGALENCKLARILSFFALGLGRGKKGPALKREKPHSICMKGSRSLFSDGQIQKQKLPSDFWYEHRLWSKTCFCFHGHFRWGQFEIRRGKNSPGGPISFLLILFCHLYGLVGSLLPFGA